MTSILTNNGAMVALQTLKGINSNLESTQNQISTGKEVSNAKDNAAIWSISKVMESDVEGFKAISSSLNIGEGTVSVAREAAEQTTDLLKNIQEKIIAAQDGTLDRDTLQKDIVALRDQITSVSDTAQFNGVNLVNGSATTEISPAVAGDPNATPPVEAQAAVTGMSVISSLDRSAEGVQATRIGVAAVDLSTDAIQGTYSTTDEATGAVTETVISLDAIDVTTDEGAQQALSAISGMITQATEAGASFGSAQNRLEMQNEFISNLADTLTSGIGSMVDADMEEASARLKALQTQQQLGVQSLSIANQAPGAIMSLFR